MLIGATRCDYKCENTVLLETQGPCGSVRKCSADTVTDDTSAQVQNVTRFLDLDMFRLALFTIRVDFQVEFSRLVHMYDVVVTSTNGRI